MRRCRPAWLALLTSPHAQPGFGYTRLDAILVSIGLPLMGWGGEAALEAGGMEPQAAGNVVLLALVGGATLAWTATYVWRVVNKDMTYVKQLDNYEAAVMQKRLEELPETELASMLAEVEAEKQRREQNPSKLL